jgi:hypothetical protein
MRKVRLSPLQRDILWLLEEAGEENLGCLKATLGTASDDDLRRAIANLKQLRFVVDSVENSSGRPAVALRPGNAATTGSSGFPMFVCGRSRQMDFGR